MTIARIGLVAGLAAVLTLNLHPAAAQQPRPKVKVTEEEPGLLAKAKITPDSATTLALGRVPGSRVETVNLEMEDGKLVYSFDLKVGQKKGVEEVLIDALTGAVVSVEHEDPSPPAAKASKAKKPPER